MTAAFPYISDLVTGLVIGFLVGLFFFVGLWITVRRVPCSKKPNSMLALSAAARLVPTLTIMFMLMRKDPGMFVAMLIGFFTVRFVMTKRMASRTNNSFIG